MNKKIFQFGYWLISLCIIGGFFSARAFSVAKSGNVSATSISPSMEFVASYGGSYTAITGEGNHIFVGEGAALTILDITDPLHPVQLSRVPLPDLVQAIFIQNGIAYIADSYSGLQIVDVQDVANPVWLGSYDTPGIVMDVIVTGPIAYLANGYEGLQVLDVSDLLSPFLLSTFPIDYFVSRIGWKSDVLYLGGLGSPLFLLNVNAPVTPYLIQEISDMDALDFTLVGNYGYFTGGSTLGLSIYDISNPGSPNLVGRYKGFPEQGEHVLVMNEIAYILYFGSLNLIDISDPTMPVQLNYILTLPNADKLYFHDQNLYISRFSNIAIMDVSDPMSLIETGQYQTYAGGGVIHIEENTAYMSSNPGLGIFDISNPVSPTLTGSFATSAGIRDLEYQNGLVYLANWYQGLKIVDVTNPISPTQIGFYPGGDVQEVEIHDDLAFLVNGGFLEIIDVSNPVSPTLEGSFSGIQRFVMSNSLLYGMDNDGFKILDVSNPISPTLLGKYVITGTFQSKPTDIAIFDQIVYLTAVPEDGMHIVDVSDPANPTLLEKQTFYSYELQTQGDYLFASSGEALKNFHILDLLDPQNPRIRSTYTLPSMFSDIQILGDLLYIGNNAGGLQILRIHPELFPPDLYLPIIRR